MLGAVIVAVELGFTLTSKPPASEVTVCTTVSVFLIVILAPGATEAGTANMKLEIVRTAVAGAAGAAVSAGADDAGADDAGAEDAGAAGVVVLDADAMGIDDIADVDEIAGAAVVCAVDEPQADRPRAMAGTTARRVILRIMRVPSLGQPMRRPRQGVRRRAPHGSLKPPTSAAVGSATCRYWGCASPGRRRRIARP